MLDFPKSAASLSWSTPFSLDHFLDETIKIMAMKAHAKASNWRTAHRGVPDQLVGEPVAAGGSQSAG
jgi:hypothetical protein